MNLCFLPDRDAQPTQWEQSEGGLVRQEVFPAELSGDGYTTWPQLANALQRHFLRVTQGSRPLSHSDLAYLRARIGHGERLNVAEFESFWRWFGKVLYKIRHHRFLPFWVRGVLYGFLSKRDTCLLLQNQPPGTFLIRFSDSNPGELAIAYRRDAQIHHYLLSAEDQKKPLIDFLAERESFSILLRVQTDPSTGEAHIQPVPKHAVIEEFQPAKARKDPVKTTAGYEPFVK